MRGSKTAIRLLWIAAPVLAAMACAPVPAPTPLAGPADFEAAITRLDAGDPDSPEVLNARFDYADFLSETPGSDCEQGLATAQSQLDTVAASQAAKVLLPLAAARIAGDEYKIHLARATCGGASPLASELQQALAAAQQAALLYRDALDYPSAVIMQFNVAAAYRQLGDTDRAVSALQSAIAMDRDYGFRQDAEDDTRLLLAWQGKPAGDNDVAALMKDFPARSAEFKFHWSSTDADVAVTATATSLIHGKIVQSQAATDLKRQIRPTEAGWTVSNALGASHYELGDWPADQRNLERAILYSLTSDLLEAPGIQVASNGDFKSVPDAQGFGASLAAEVSARVSAQIGGPASDDNLRPAFSPDFLEAKAAEDYGIRTATWIGAKLDQGAWYQMSTPLFLPDPVQGHYLVQHNVSFAFTRELACAAGSNRLCVEIIAHANPDAKDLGPAVADMAARLKVAAPQFVYWSQTDLRLVIDPQTLLSYVCDIRQTWYGAVRDGKGEPAMESVRTVSTSSYH